MANLNNVAILVSRSCADGADNMGIAKKNSEAEICREVFCNDKSTGYNEFFAARRAGVDTQIRLEILADEYNKEDTVIFEGKRYKIVRAYKIENTGRIELSLTDLPKRGASVGAV